jgi:quercetin dioxygenase-like cupin family protein
MTFYDPSMLVRTRDEVAAAGKELRIAGGSATSARYITKSDSLGFSFSDVTMEACQEARLWYRHHWEANYILAGTGEVEDVATGRRWPLAPGTIYIVGPDDRHVVRATTDLHLVSVFNPPIEGDENHDENGSYPPTGAIPTGPRP